MIPVNLGNIDLFHSHGSLFVGVMCLSHLSSISFASSFLKKLLTLPKADLLEKLNLLSERRAKRRHKGALILVLLEAVVASRLSPVATSFLVTK